MKFITALNNITYSIYEWG